MRSSGQNRAFRGRSIRALLALLVASVLAVAQGAEHSHASTPEAAQCAVCHWGKADPPPPMPSVASVPRSVVHAAPEVRPRFPSFRGSRGMPPVRGPPSLI